MSLRVLWYKKETPHGLASGIFKKIILTRVQNCLTSARAKLRTDPQESPLKHPSPTAKGGQDILEEGRNSGI